VYFDTASGFQKPNIPSQVSYQDNVDMGGQTSYKITTTGGTWYFHKLGGAFASLIDRDGNDWISHSAASGSQGLYRGIPNAGIPEGGLHPGDTRMTSSVVSSGPLKMTIYTETDDKLWAGTYEIYPNYARFTLQKAAQNYWFLYEGTPGGKINPGSDYLIRSDGSRLEAGPQFDGDFPDPEWMYVADGTINRSLFMQHENDSITDTFWILDDNMTVFGWGRSGSAELSALPAHLTIGLIDTRDYNTAKPIIEGAFAVPNISAGNPESNSNAGPTITQPPSTECATKSTGDADCDGVTTVLDYVLWRSEYRAGCSVANLTAAACGDDRDGNGNIMDGDFNNDGKASVLDFPSWKRNIR
jgi:hypothetical protein